MEAYPLSGCAFRVSVCGAELGFSKISGVQRETELLTYQEGGLNDRVHTFAAPCKAERVLRLEKGVYEGAGHPFYLVGERLSDALRLEVLDGAGAIQKTYTLCGVTVKKWEVGELDAAQSALLIDRFELSYETVEPT